MCFTDLGLNKEQQLIQLALSMRDSAAFSALVKLHQGRIRAFLVRLCKDYDHADDIAQETFISAHRKLNTFKGDGSFSAWLFKIAYNNFLQHQRSSNRRGEIVVEYQQQFDVLQDKYEEISEAQIDLEKALSRLNTSEAAAITLCHSIGFSHQEVADILKMPLGTIKTNINRGKSKLREMLLRNTLEKAS